MPPWTDKEIEEVQSCRCIKEATHKLGKSYSAVQQALHRRGLSKFTRRAFSAEEDSRLKILAQTMSIKQIAATLDRSYNSVEKRLVKLNIEIIRSCGGRIRKPNPVDLPSDAFANS